MENIPDSPALGRALHDLYTALTLVYHEAEGLQRSSENRPLLTFLEKMDDQLAGRTFLVEHGTAMLPAGPEALVVALAAALQHYRARLEIERERQQNAERPMP